MLANRSALLGGAMTIVMVASTPASAKACCLLDWLFCGCCCRCKPTRVCPPPPCDPCAAAPVYPAPAAPAYRPTTRYYEPLAPDEPTPTYDQSPASNNEFGTYEMMPSLSARSRTHPAQGWRLTLPPPPTPALARRPAETGNHHRANTAVNYPRRSALLGGTRVQAVTPLSSAGRRSVPETNAVLWSPRAGSR